MQLNKDKFKFLSAGLTKGKAFGYIITTMEDKVKQNPSIDMGELEYNNLFRVTLQKLLMSPNEDLLTDLLAISMIIAICSEDVKPMTIAECTAIEILYPENKEITDKTLEDLNNKIVKEWDRLTEPKFKWSKDAIAEIKENIL